MVGNTQFSDYYFLRTPMKYKAAVYFETLYIIFREYTYMGLFFIWFTIEPGSLFSLCTLLTFLQLHILGAVFVCNCWSNPPFQRRSVIFQSKMYVTNYNTTNDKRMNSFCWADYLFILCSLSFSCGNYHYYLMFNDDKLLRWGR